MINHLPQVTRALVWAAASGINVANFAQRTFAFEGAWKVLAVHSGGASGSVLTFVHVLAPGRGLDVSGGASALSTIATLTILAVEVGVTSRSAELIHTNLALFERETVMV